MTKEETAKAIVNGDSTAVATSSSTGVGATIANIIGGGLSVTDNQRGGQLSNVTDPRMLTELIDNFSDTEAIDGDLVSLSDNVAQMNQTARDFIYEPAALEILASIHAPYKFTSSPIPVTFDANGEIKIGSDTSTKMEFAFDSSVQPGILGFMFRFTSADTLNTLTQLQITTAEGIDILSKLRDANKEGWVCVLGHVRDVSASLTGSVAFVAPNFVATEFLTTTPVSQQFTFDYSGKAKFAIAGKNANVDAYPIYPSREVLALVRGLYYADRMDSLPDALVALYSQVSNSLAL